MNDEELIAHLRTVIDETSDEIQALADQRASYREELAHLLMKRIKDERSNPVS